MNILFLTLVDFYSFKERTIYTDLLREFANHGHNVCVISTVEKKYHKGTRLIEEEKGTILKLEIGNTQKTGPIKKGISTVMIEQKFKKAIKNYFSNIKFEVIIYSTPPITLVAAIEYIKKRDNAISYLLLKDIFPQNALDLGMLQKRGIRGLLYSFFRNKEKRLYSISDHIGCMSRANIEYVLRHNPEVDSKKVELCPNCVEVVDNSVDSHTRIIIREKYGIPLNKKVFVYGGNLGKPQGIPFLIKCIKRCSIIEDVFFLIVGEGTEYGLIEDYVNNENPNNLMLIKQLPKEDYDTMVGACDVGMIFLNHKFTIPNYPSRLLSYLQAKLPVLACTDTSTDIGKVVVEGGFGWWCESNSSDGFMELIMTIRPDQLSDYGQKGFEYMSVNYSTLYSYNVIMTSINN